jgi:hypothetical protein
MNLQTTLLAILFLGFKFSLAQYAEKPPRIFLMGAQAVYQNASGPFTSQFNDNFGIGIQVGYKFSKPWVISASGNYLFGGLVNNAQAVLSPMLTQNNQVLNSTGGFARISVYTRGAYGFLNVERLLNWGQVNANSGPIIGAGGGYLWHWIRVDNAGNDVAALQGQYAKGYDNLSHGPAFKASLGYLYLSTSRLINFKLSFEVISSYTQNVRQYDYATGPVSNAVQNNLLYGLKLNWYIPIYRGAKTEEYYVD